MLIRPAALAAMAAVVLSTAASAETRQPVSASVSTRGLDLATAQGQAKLAQRVDRAAYDACYGRDMVEANKAGLPLNGRCVNEVRRDAQAKIAAIGGDTTGGN